MGISPRFWAGKSVFLTGHTGFKGSWLALWLQSLGAEPVGFSNGVPTKPSLFKTAGVGRDMVSLGGDVRDLDRLRTELRAARPEIVIHMAAQALVQRSLRAPAETYSTNVMGTVNVLEAIRGVGDVRVLLNVTSDKCYRNQGENRAYREGDPLGGSDPYSSSKACAELVTEAYRESVFRGSDVRIASARAGNVIGGGDWAPDRLVPDVIRAALEGRAAVLRNPRSLRPWQHVLNPLHGYMLLIERLWDDGGFAAGWNFGPDDHDVRPVRWVAERLAALWDGGIALEERQQRDEQEATTLRLDCSRARERLGWRPYWELDLGLENVVDWYRAFAEGEDIRAATLVELTEYEARAHAVEGAIRGTE
jgi:CDP-glucose 4,6-dehydratase